MGDMSGTESISVARQPYAALAELTPRQLDVLKLLCEGLPNKLIGRRLNIASATVKIHVGCILRALRVSSRLQAVLAVRSLGLALGSSAGELAETVPAPRNALVSLLVPDDDDASRLLADDSDWSLAAAAG